MIKISAVICTHNNCKVLKKSIESLQNQSLDKNDFEILVVDNRSEDGTKQVVLEFIGKSSNIRYIYERNLGISYARNRGIIEGRGEYVAFLDDDAEADKDWLFSLLRCFEQVNPKPDIVGGKVFLRYEIENIPKYIDSFIESFYAKIDHGDKGFFIEKLKKPEGYRKLTHYLVATNFCLKKNVTLKTGFFDEIMGSKGKSLLSGNIKGEETEFIVRAAENNCLIFYEPLAKVTHFIPRQRLERLYLISRLFAQGITEVMMLKKDKTSRINNFLFIIKKLQSIIICVRALFIVPKYRNFSMFIRICHKFGEIFGVFFA